MQGAFLSPELGWPFLAFAVLGVVLAAVYLLKLYRTVFMGEVTNPANSNLPDLSRRELAALVILCVPIVVLGLYPYLLLNGMQTTVADLIDAVGVVAGR